MLHVAEYIGNKPDEAFAAVDPIPQTAPWETVQQGIEEHLINYDEEQRNFDALVAERIKNPELRPSAKKAK